MVTHLHTELLLHPQRTSGSCWGQAAGWHCPGGQGTCTPPAGAGHPPGCCPVPGHKAAEKPPGLRASSSAAAPLVLGLSLAGGQLPAGQCSTALGGQHPPLLMPSLAQNATILGWQQHGLAGRCQLGCWAGARGSSGQGQAKEVDSSCKRGAQKGLQGLDWMSTLGPFQLLVSVIPLGLFPPLTSVTPLCPFPARQPLLPWEQAGVPLQRWAGAVPGRAGAVPGPQGAAEYLSCR